MAAKAGARVVVAARVAAKAGARVAGKAAAMVAAAARAEVAAKAEVRVAGRAAAKAATTLATVAPLPARARNNAPFALTVSWGTAGQARCPFILA